MAEQRMQEFSDEDRRYREEKRQHTVGAIQQAIDMLQKCDMHPDTTRTVREKLKTAKLWIEGEPL